jgi:GT2 family glycosyltransferase
VVDGAPVEVLVVDNASTDATKDVVGAHPGVRYVFEGRLGLSRARNRALEEATGGVVAFLDDDAVAVDGWAQHHATAVAEEGVAATGGPIALVWPNARPGWMPVALEGLYAGLDLGSAARDFTPSETPYGANMAVRRAAALAIGGFNPKLGRSGASLISNEETEFFVRLRADYRVRYIPGARVAHAVVPGRDRLGYVLRRAYAAGRSDVIAGSAPAKPAAARSLIGNLARVVTLRGGGEWGLRGAVAGAAWAAEDVGRLVGTSGRRGP